MNAVARQRVQEDGQRGHERFTLTGGHFGNLALMQDDAAEELYVVVNHVPRHVVATGHPVVLIDGLVALDAHKVVRGGQLAVKVGSRHLDFGIFAEAPRRVLHDGKSFGQGLVQCLFVTVEHLLFQFVDAVENHLAVFERRFFYFAFQFRNFLFQVVGRALDALLQFLGFGTQGVVVERADGGIGSLDLFHPRLDELHVPGRFVSEELAQNFVDIHFVLLFFTLCDACWRRR